MCKDCRSGLVGAPFEGLLVLEQAQLFWFLKESSFSFENSNCHSIFLKDWAKPPIITVWYQEILIHYLQFPFSILFHFISVQTIVLVTSVRITNCISALSVHPQDQ